MDTILQKPIGEMNDAELRELGRHAKAHPDSEAARKVREFTAAIDELLADRRARIERFMVHAQASAALLHKVDSQRSFNADTVRAVAESDARAVDEAGYVLRAELTLPAPDWNAALAAWGKGGDSDLAGTRRRQMQAMLAALGR